MLPLKGKIINWIVFVILLLILFGLLLFFQSGKKTQTIVPPPVTEETKVTKPKKEFAGEEFSPEEKESKDNDAFNQALLSGKGCENIKYDDKLRLLCVDTLTYYEAIRKSDETLCGQIKDDDLKTKCYDQVYLSVAIKNSDKSLCEKIKDPDVKQNCSDQVLVLSGTPVKQASDCNVVKDAALKQKCLDNYYFAASTNTADSAGCAQISSADLKDRCVKTIAKNAEIAELSKKESVRTFQTSEQKLQSCSDMSGTDATFCKDQANFTLAGEKKDISYCSKIIDSQLQSSCIATQSIAINSYYLKQAIRLKDTSLCNKILDSALRSSCLSNTK
jgi:hypothetical protein